MTWTKVEDGFPVVPGFYVVQGEPYFLEVTYFHPMSGFRFTGKEVNNIIAWQPIEPYEEKKENKPNSIDERDIGAAKLANRILDAKWKDDVKMYGTSQAELIVEAHRECCNKPNKFRIKFVGRTIKNIKETKENPFPAIILQEDDIVSFIPIEEEK